MFTPKVSLRVLLSKFLFVYRRLFFAKLRDTLALVSVTASRDISTTTFSHLSSWNHSQSCLVIFAKFSKFGWSSEMKIHRCPLPRIFLVSKHKSLRFPFSELSRGLIDPSTLNHPLGLRRTTCTGAIKKISDRKLSTRGTPLRNSSKLLLRLKANTRFGKTYSGAVSLGFPVCRDEQRMR